MEYSTTSDIRADADAYTDRKVRIAGRRVAESSGLRSVATGGLNYMTIEDDSGRLEVWYNAPQLRMRCPPRIGAELTVKGTVRELTVIDPELAETMTRNVFSATSISIDDEPSLDHDTIRLCQLSLKEQSVYAYEGPEGLQVYWRANGKPVRTVVEQ